MLGKSAFADITPRRPLVFGEAFGLYGLARASRTKKYDRAIA